MHSRPKGPVVDNTFSCPPSSSKRENEYSSTPSGLLTNHTALFSPAPLLTLLVPPAHQTPQIRALRNYMLTKIPRPILAQGLLPLRNSHIAHEQHSHHA